MREIIITSANAESVYHAQRLIAAEGYVELGMFEEAEAELGQLDPSWRELEPAVALRIRVYAGLRQLRKARALANAFVHGRR